MACFALRKAQPVLRNKLSNMTIQALVGIEKMPIDQE
jgi:hypothetical protein